MKKFIILFIILFMMSASYIKADDLSEYFNVGDIKICDDSACNTSYDEEHGIRASAGFLVKFDWSLHSSTLIKAGDTVTIPFANNLTTETTTSFGNGGFSWTDIYDENSNKIGQWMISGTTDKKLFIKFSDSAVGKTDIGGTFVTTKNFASKFTYVDKVVPLTVGSKTVYFKVNTYTLGEPSSVSSLSTASSTNNKIVLSATSPRITAKQLYDINKYSNFTADALLSDLYFELSLPSELNASLNKIILQAFVFLPTDTINPKASYNVTGSYELSVFTKVSPNDGESYLEFKNRLNKFEYGVYSEGDNKIIVANYGEQPSQELKYKDIINKIDSSIFEPGDYGNSMNPFTVDSQTKEVINNLAGTTNRIQGKVFSWGMLIYLDFPTVKTPTTKQVSGTWSWMNGNGEVKSEQRTVEATLIVPQSMASASGASQLLLRDKDSKNEIAGVSIKLQKKNGETYEDIDEGVTDSSGYIMFTNLESGTYRFIQTSYLDYYQNNSFITYNDVDLNNKIQEFEFDKNNGNIIYATNEKEKFTITYLPGEHGNFSEQTYNNIAYGSATPNYSPTGENNWIFKGWNPEVDLFVTENKTYTALWKKLVKVTTKYLEYGTDREIGTSIESIGENETPYTTEKKEFANYEYIETLGNASGIRGEEDIVVKYYYKKKESRLNIRYLDCRNQNEIVNSTSVKVYYGDNYDSDNYESNISIPQNYNRVAANKSDNYKGTVSSNSIDVEYCYNKKDSDINSDIIATGTNEITHSKDKISYKIDYNAYFTDYIGSANIVIVDKLPYKIDVNASNLDGGVYDDNTKTITWNINTNIDSYSNNKYSVTKNIELSYLGINIKEDVIANNISGNLTTDDKSNNVSTNYNTYININGTLTVKYMDSSSNKELLEEIVTTDKAGKKYELDFKEIEGYNLIKKPDDKIYEYKEGNEEIKLIYERIKLKVNTNILTDGGTISGNEEVLYGDDSTKDKINIKADEGYYISEVIINGKSIVIPEKQTELTIPNFINMKEDINIDVSFNKAGDNVTVPNTSKKTKLSYFGIITIIVGVISGVYILYKKRIICLKK